jgi:hypothetical protein
MHPFSGPKGSPLDKDDTGNASTGALNTGIGFGSNVIIGLTAPASIDAAGFDDDYQPGLSTPDPTVDATDSTFIAIGGGRSDPDGTPNPYTAGFSLCGAGNGGSRDGGAGPAFTGFPVKTVTASAGVANGAAVEAGWTNRSGKSLTTGQSTFGSATSANAAPTLLSELEPAPEPDPE